MKVHEYLLIVSCLLCACESPNSTKNTDNPPAREAEKIETPVTIPELRETLPVTEDSQESSADSRVEQIEKQIGQLNKHSELYLDTIPYMDQSTEGGEIRSSYNPLGELVKLEVFLFGEMAKGIEVFYLKQNKLFFYVNQEYKYNRPIYYTDSSYLKENKDTELFDPKKTVITETRYYFDEKERLIRHINPNKEATEESMLDLDMEAAILKSLKELRARIKSHALEQESQDSVMAEQFNPELHAWMKSIAEDQPFNYFYEEFDLNEDGIPEYLCGLRGKFWCGSGGCSFVVVERTSGGLRLHSRGGPTYGPHYISKEKKNGWHTIVLDPSSGETSDGITYKNYPVMTFQTNAYETEWLDDLDGAERIDALLEGATKVLSDDREFHRVQVEDR